ncbi:MAG: hypothetical protein WC863_01000 [Patescibacteria group bacterium]
MFFGKLKNKIFKNGGSLKNPKILEVNLVKDNIAVSFDWGTNILVLVLTLALASVLVAEIYFGLNWWNKQESLKIVALKTEADKINQTANQIKQQAAVALDYKDRSVVFINLMDNHVHWTNFFSWLEKRTLSNVKYDGFGGDLSGTYLLAATTPTLADVSWQVNSFLKDSLVETVEVGGAAFGKGEDKTKRGQVSFSLSLTVKPELFKNKYDEPKSKK